MTFGACLSAAPFAGDDFTIAAWAQAGLNGARPAGTATTTAASRPAVSGKAVPLVPAPSRRNPATTRAAPARRPMRPGPAIAQAIDGGGTRAASVGMRTVAPPASV